MATNLKRITVTGLVNPYRDGHGRDTLAATLKVNDKTFFYPRCPKAWAELTHYNPNRTDVTNLFEVTVTINEDGTNPRNTSLIRYIPR